jgi:ribose transport system substrate-binding protein
MNRRQFLKQSGAAAAAVAGGLALPGVARKAQAQDESYFMVTFVSGIDYWKDCFRGMEDAAAELGVSATYTGTPENDITAQVRVLDEVIGQNPAGILLTCLNPDGLLASINNAIDAGIPLVTFDADSPLSKRYSFVGTGNYYAGVVAARYLGPLVGEGQVAIASVAAQLNHVQRRQGFIDTLAAEYPNVTTDDSLIVDDQNNSTVAAQGMAGVLQANPDVRGIFATDASGGVGVAQAVRESGLDVPIIAFDYDEGTLDLIDSGQLSATLAQGTWQMGYWGMKMLKAVVDGQIQSVSDWRAAGISPLPPNVDTGVVVITAENSQYWRQSS